MSLHFDLLIIGGGSGGIAAAAKATDFGAKCVIFEHSHLGGTCSNFGCIPKKLMWHAASISEYLKSSQNYGFTLNSPSFNWKDFLAARENHIGKIRDYYQEYLAKRKITLVRDTARFIDQNTILAGNQSFVAKHIIIATGTKPIVPDIPGSEHGITSDDLFLLENQPKKIAIIGSGYIAVELSCILQSLGSEVTLIIRTERILKNFDSMISDILLKQLKTKLTVIEKSSVTNVEKNAQGLQLYVNKELLDKTFDAVLWATGRAPVFDDLNLATTKIKINENQSIQTNHRFETNVKNIFAIGDVTVYPQLAPIAIAQGKMVAANIFGDKKINYNLSLIPTAVFAIPPAGAIGLTESEAIKKYGKQNIVTFQKSFVALFDSINSEPLPGAIKLVCVKKNHQIIGCHLVARDAHEIIQGFVLAMNKGATLSDLKNCLTIHPSVAEEIMKI